MSSLALSQDLSQTRKLVALYYKTVNVFGDAGVGEEALLQMGPSPTKYLFFTKKPFPTKYLCFPPLPHKAFLHERL